eukprot:GEMP01052024.1.p3 GENE.GEMP01052024.1~~GEMP01052024.1.p3  ORF type:complete len:104 (-),score=10.19 GEMP01052024.1:314-625(-)
MPLCGIDAARAHLLDSAFGNSTSRSDSATSEMHFFVVAFDIRRLCVPAQLFVSRHKVGLRKGLANQIEIGAFRELPKKTPFFCACKIHHCVCVLWSSVSHRPF